MIESETMARLAANRQTVVVTHPRRGVQSAQIAPLSRVTLAILVLWPVPMTPENKLTRTDAWAVLVLERATDWHPAILFAGDLEIHTPGGDARPFPPVDLAVPVSRTDARPLAESACLAARDRLRVEFSYRKDGHPIEQRAGVAVGVRDDLLFVEDTARVGQLRSFRLDRIAALRCVGSVPTWDGAEYRMPGTPKPWGDDPFAGFGEEGNEP